MNMRNVLAAAALALCPCPTALAQDAARPSLPKVVTSATSTIKAPAERARLTIGVTAKAAKARDAAARVASLMSSVRDALVAAGLERRSLVSAGYSVSTQDDPEARNVKAYLATSSLSAELSELAQLGAVVDTALAAGATDVSQIEFRVKDERLSARRRWHSRSRRRATTRRRWRAQRAPAWAVSRRSRPSARCPTARR